MHRLFVLSLFLLLVAAGIVVATSVLRRLSARPGDLRPGELTEISLKFGGETRSYFVHVPATGGKGAAVMVLHGGEGDGVHAARASHMSAWADQHRFVALFPNAATAHGGRTPWNDGRAETANGRDDVGFVRAVVADASARFGVDPDRVFVAGISSGGLFAQRLACEAPGAFRAFGVIAANMPADLAPRCRPSQAVPMVFFNGTADRLMPWEGGEIPSIRALGIGSGGTVLSHSETVRFWTEIGGCGANVTSVLPDRARDGTRVTLASYKRCSSGKTPDAALDFYTVQGGGHNWPGSGLPARRITGVVTANIDASAEILAFFRRYGL